jgi:hypothetical protein
MAKNLLEPGFDAASLNFALCLFSIHLSFGSFYGHSDCYGNLVIVWVIDIYCPTAVIWHIKMRCLQDYNMLWLSNISKLLTQSTIYSVVLVAKWEELGYTSICGLQPHHRMQEAIVMAQRSIPEWDSELKSLLQLGTSWFEAQKMIQTCPRLL